MRRAYVRAISGDRRRRERRVKPGRLASCAKGFRGVADTVGEVRVTRAYLAGLGAAGSLLAVAALAFVLASVFVSFRGWPLGGDRLPPTVVSVKPPASQNAARREPAINLRPATAGSAGAVALGLAPPGAGARGKAVVVASGPLAGQPGASPGLVDLGGIGPLGSAGPLAPVARPSTSPGPCSGECAGKSARGGLGPVVQSATRQLGATVGATGSSLGSDVRTVAAPVSRLLDRVSPPLSGVVSSAGEALGSTIGRTAQAAGGVIVGAGHVLGSVLSPEAPG